jgi:hypothetical protein
MLLAIPVSDDTQPSWKTLRLKTQVKQAKGPVLKPGSSRKKWEASFDEMSFYYGGCHETEMATNCCIAKKIFW